QEGRGFSLDHPGFGGLTYQRPPLCAGDPITGFSSNGLPVFGVHVLPGTIRAADYDDFPVSGEGHTTHDLSPGNAGGQYRAGDVDIACSAEGQPVLSSLAPGEWVTYTVHVPTAGNYTIGVRYAAAAAGGAIRIAFGGADVVGDVALAATSGSWRTITVAGGVPLKAGVQALRVSIAGAANAFDLDSITVSGAN
ncbi:MAG TPA: carbohydrate-binding protein, partial [Polyangia bacterium]|nr:carbohydrate-binding protein [Polyangia bacterium]